LKNEPTVVGGGRKVLAWLIDFSLALRVFD
jgi:hypothetical protein